MGAKRRLVKNVAATQTRNVYLGRLLGVAMLVVIVAASAALVGHWLGRPETLPIQRVQVEGEFRYLAREDLYAAIGDLTSGGFFNVDVRAVKQAAESLPWVHRVSVRRQWPDSLRIDIREQQPLAYWGQQQMVNVDGELFQPEASAMEAPLPRFNGPQGSSTVMVARYRVLATALSVVGLGIAELQLNERRAWAAQLDNGVRLLLGRSLNDTQLQRFISAYPRALAENTGRMDSVDLRYSNGFAVRWKTGLAEENV